MERLLVKSKWKCGDNIEMSLREMDYEVDDDVWWFALYVSLYSYVCNSLFFSPQVRLGCMCQ